MGRCVPRPSSSKLVTNVLVAIVHATNVLVAVVLVVIVLATNVLVAIVLVAILHAAIETATVQTPGCWQGAKRQRSPSSQRRLAAR